MKKNRKGKERMKDYELYGRIKQCVDNNIMVYDEEAILTITKKLIYHMYDVSFDELQKLYIPTDVFPDFDFAQPQYGVEVVRDRRFNYEESEKMIEELGISLPCNKTQLVLGVWGDESLLGAV